MLDLYIKKLVNYGINTGLIPECERIYSTNLLLEVFGKDDYTDLAVDDKKTLAIFSLLFVMKP